MLTPEQIAGRYKTLGASDAARVFEGRALEVYCEKLQLTPPFEGNEMTEWGNRLESKVAEKYAEANGVTLLESPTLTHPVLSWASCTPDRICVDADGEQRLLEVKTTGVSHAAEWGEAGTDQVPHRVAVQVAWQMFVTGNERCDVAVLIGGQTYRQYSLRRDAEIEQALVAQMTDFWENHVVLQIAPELDGSEAAHRYLAHLYPRNIEDLAPADEKAEEAMRDLADLKTEAKALEENISELEARLKSYIGFKDGLVGTAGRATWKLAASGAVSWKRVADELGVPADLVAKHTSAPSRRFLFQPSKETP